MIRKLAYLPFFIKLLHWEYWPFHVVYGPVYFVWLWLCLRARSIFFFNTANPSITNGGFLMESKRDIYKLLPEGSYPLTLFFMAGCDSAEVISSVRLSRFRYPLIGKPDVGMKGMSVKTLHDEAELVAYVQQSKVNFLIQEFIPWENECGIFYYRYPSEPRGNISGIVGKEFLTVTGDGQSTVLELLKRDKRYVLQLPVLKKTYGEALQKILAGNESFVLVPYGNHVRGAKFIDLSHLVDEKLTAAIDAVCLRVNGFYYGRLDVRYKNWDDLTEGRNFSIIELNGAGSEPTHMYDPRHSLFFAWREISRHWRILWRISRMNHHKEKRPYMGTREGFAMLRENRAYVKLIAGHSS